MELVVRAKGNVSSENKDNSTNAFVRLTVDLVSMLAENQTEEKSCKRPELAHKQLFDDKSGLSLYTITTKICASYPTVCWPNPTHKDWPCQTLPVNRMYLFISFLLASFLQDTNKHWYKVFYQFCEWLMPFSKKTVLWVICENSIRGVS